MKKALVLSLAVVLGLGVASFAQTFSGSWDMDLVLEINPVQSDALTVDSLTSILVVDYTISGWTFGLNSYVDEDDLFDLNFDVSGQLGAFALYSLLDFDPLTQTPSFTSWENVATVSIAGVDLWGAFVLQDVLYSLAGTGTGWAVGAHGVAGLVEVWVEADFNLDGSMYYWYNYGLDYMLDWGTAQSGYCTGAWASGWFAVQTESCNPSFSNIDIVVETQLACLDLLIWANFDCTHGFDYITIGLNDINIGAGWFQIDDVDVTFTAASKAVTTDFTLTFGSAVCVTPYFDLNQVGMNVIEGITLQALLLNFNYNGITLKAGELFPNAYYIGFNKVGGLVTYSTPLCVVPNANEFIGLWYTADGCCGGAVAGSFVVFFDGIYSLPATPADTSASTGIFDFLLIVGKVEFGITADFSVSAGFEVTDLGLETFSVGFGFDF